MIAKNDVVGGDLMGQTKRMRDTDVRMKDVEAPRSENLSKWRNAVRNVLSMRGAALLFCLLIALGPYNVFYKTDRPH